MKLTRSLFYVAIISILVFSQVNCSMKSRPSVDPDRSVTPPSDHLNSNRDAEDSRFTSEYQRGIASWYGGKFHGRRTSNGEIYDKFKLTAAHKVLPFNSFVKVTNLENNRSVIVRINDRGPFVKGRIIDLSKKAARRIGMEETGTAQVKLELLSGKRKKALKESPVFKVERWYFVQAGAFSERRNAERVLAKIKRVTVTGFFIKEADGLFKVISVNLSPRALAEKVAFRLKEFKIDSFVKEKH